MDYKTMKKDELLEVIKKLEPLSKAGKELVHLPKAIEEKEKEILGLREAKDKLIEKFDKQINDLKNELTDKFNKELAEYKKNTDAELKKKTDTIVELQKRYEELDKLRIEQLEEVLYAYGDLLKIMQGTVDTHMKLNTLVVNKLGGKK